MEYIHEVNEEFKENLKQMLCSPDLDTICFGLEILNNVDLSDKETHKHIMELILDTDCGLCISFQDENGYFVQENSSSVTDLNKNKFYFYSANIINKYISDKTII